MLALCLLLAGGCGTTGDRPPAGATSGPGPTSPAASRTAPPTPASTPTRAAPPPTEPPSATPTIAPTHTPTPVGTAHPLSRPNIVFILTDDQRFDTLPYMPDVQRLLVAQGVSFSNAFVTTPLCCPSRASILTGLYAHHHGVHTNLPPNGGFDVFHDESTVATWLHAAGYRTALIGKYLNAYTDAHYVPPGWDDWHAFGDANSYFKYELSENGQRVAYDAPDQYMTDVLRDKALAFIRSTQGQPFFLYFAPKAPHGPYQPAPRHAGFYAGLAPLRPPNYNEEDLSDKPLWMRKLPPLDDQEVDQVRELQLETLLGVDEAVTAIVQALDETGQLDQTVIVFTSDNGFGWGAHRLLGKRDPYEESLRVPLVIRYPGIPTGENDQLVLNIDYAPTLADIANVAVPSSVDGVSLMPLLEGTARAWRDDFLFEHWKGEDVPTYTGVRTRDWKYVEYEKGEQELYDLADDPYELNNLAADPRFAEQLAALARRLIALQRR